MRVKICKIVLPQNIKKRMFSAGDDSQNYIKTSVNNADYSGKITLLYEERSNEK